MAWQTPITNWGIGGQTTPGVDDFNRIEGNILDLHQSREHEQNMIVYGLGASIPPSVLPPDAPENIFFNVVGHEVTVNSPPAGTVKKYKITKTYGGGLEKLTVKFNFTSTTYVLYLYDTLFVHIDNTSGTPIMRAHLLRGQESGTFTPTLSFGGSSTGITYHTRRGIYTRIGNLVHFSLNMALSNKGSASGDVYISGLPVPPASGAFQRVNTQMLFNLSGPNAIGVFELSGYGGYLIRNSYEFQPFDHRDFTNNTYLSISGSYISE